MPTDPKSDLHDQIRNARSALLWKLDGLTDYEVRRPMTPTCTSLLGLVKHVASAELMWFGYVFGRPSDEPTPWVGSGTGPQDANFAGPDESCEDVVAMYERACAHSDATIDALALDAEGTFPFWPEDRATVTLHRVLAHMTAETHRHAGHADIIRELIDGAVGKQQNDLDIRGAFDAAGWDMHRARLLQIARGQEPPVCSATDRSR